jgi:molybdopterin-guanine dinucleotide biosynthesis protein A
MDHLLDDLPAAWSVVCVGKERVTTRPVGWCRESPVGGGPVAGIAAGLDYLGRHGQPRLLHPEICVVVGGDMPFAAAALPGLVDALKAQPGLDAVLATDPDGRTQPLLAAYRVAALRAALPPEARGARLMAVVDALLTGTLVCEAPATLDVDTPDALELARHIVCT